MLKALHFAVSFTFVVLMVWIIWTSAILYAESSHTGLARLWDAAKGSATKLWAKFVMFVASIVGAIGTFGDLIGVPEIKGHVTTLIGNEQIVAGAFLLIAAGSWLARNRTS